MWPDSNLKFESNFRLDPYSDGGSSPTGTEWFFSSFLRAHRPVKILEGLRLAGQTP
jgi:hypothetical protein